MKNLQSLPKKNLANILMIILSSFTFAQPLNAITLEFKPQSLSEKTCDAGKYFDPRTKNCQPCLIDRCKSCYFEEEGQRVLCNECQRYTFLKNNLCQSCPDNCVLCNADKCLVCRQSYYWDKTICLKCPDYCSACSNKGRCYKCYPGFKTDSSTGTCVTPSPLFEYLVRMGIFSISVFGLFLCFFIPRCFKIRNSSKKNHLDRYLQPPRSKEEEGQGETGLDQGEFEDVLL